MEMRIIGNDFIETSSTQIVSIRYPKYLPLLYIRSTFTHELLKKCPPNAQHAIYGRFMKWKLVLDLVVDTVRVSVSFWLVSNSEQSLYVAISASPLTVEIKFHRNKCTHMYTVLQSRCLRQNFLQLLLKFQVTFPCIQSRKKCHRKLCTRMHVNNSR